MVVVATACDFARRVASFLTGEASAGWTLVGVLKPDALKAWVPEHLAGRLRSTGVIEHFRSHLSDFDVMFQPMPLVAPGRLPTPNFLRSSRAAWK